MIVAAQNDPTYEYEDSSVEIRLSREYVEYCRHVTPIYSRAATHFCKGALELDYDECEFFLPGIPTLSRIGLVSAMKAFGIILDWEECEEDDEAGVLFHADLTGANQLFTGRFDMGQ